MSTIILKSDDRIFDTNGKPLRKEKQMVDEPYDPAYLEKDVDYTVDIPKSEISMFRRIEKLMKALRKAKIHYRWNEIEFRVEKEIGGHTHTRCLWVEGNQFCYGTDDVVYLETADVNEVVAKIVKWTSK